MTHVLTMGGEHDWATIRVWYAAATMRLAGLDGPVLALRPLRYEFPDAKPCGVGGMWDANWLLIEGEVSTSAGAWSFTNACLTTWEARRLGAWLRAAGNRQPASDAGDHPTPPSGVHFLEPVLEFGISGDGTGGSLDLRVELRLEALPPWQSHEAYVLILLTPPAALLRAADEWEQELLPLPQR
jgi:hypothetical protein